MVRLRWRGHRDDGGQSAGTPDNGLRPDGTGAPTTGWARPATSGQSQVPGWLQLTAGWAWRLLVVGVVIYLTFRLASVLRLVVQGMANKEIAAKMEISESAVKNTMQQLFGKTGVRTRSQLVRVALEQYRNLL